MTLQSQLLTNVNDFDPLNLRYMRPISSTDFNTYSIYYKSSHRNKIFKSNRVKLIIASPVVTIGDIRPTDDNKYSIAIELKNIPDQYNEYNLYRFCSVINKIDEVNTEMLSTFNTECTHTNSIDNTTTLHATSDHDVSVFDFNDDVIDLTELKQKFLARVVIEISRLVIDGVESKCVFNVLQIKLVVNENPIKTVLYDNCIVPVNKYLTNYIWRNYDVTDSYVEFDDTDEIDNKIVGTDEIVEVDETDSIIYPLIFLFVAGLFALGVILILHYVTDNNYVTDFNVSSICSSVLIICLLFSKLVWCD